MATYKIGGEEFSDFEQFGRRCGCPRPSYSRVSQIDAKMREFRAANEAFRTTPGTIRIPIQFIHIVNGTEGQIEPKTREGQVEVLNTAFAPHRIEFTYSENDVKVKDHAAWFRMGHGSAAERAAKKALQVDPEANLNFYTTNGGGLLGWATFPSELEGDPELDGVVVVYSSLPNVADPPYNLGETATHEIGHWLGLFHTFQGGCDGHGDHVGDTVPHSGPNFGKPEKGKRHNACDPSKKAPIHNYMNYVDDDWMDRFSDEQVTRMREMVAAFRPELLERSDPALSEACTSRISRAL